MSLSIKKYLQQPKTSQKYPTSFENSKSIPIGTQISQSGRHESQAHSLNKLYYVCP